MTPALAVALGDPVAKKYSSPGKMIETKGRWRVRRTDTGGDQKTKTDSARKKDDEEKRW